MSVVLETFNFKDPNDLKSNMRELLVRMGGIRENLTPMVPTRGWAQR